MTKQAQRTARTKKPAARTSAARAKPTPAAKPRARPAARKPVSRAVLEARLREAEETLDAIRSGDVDALVVQGPTGDQVFTLKGADHRYRQLVETMNEGALMLTQDCTIVYANARFATLVDVPLEKLIGSELQAYIADTSHDMVGALLQQRVGGAAKAEVDLVATDGTRVPVYLSATASWDEDHQLTCVIATDLSEQKRSLEMVAAERLTARIVEQAAEGIVVCDLSGSVIRASKAAHRIAGTNPLLRSFEDVFELHAADDLRASRTVLDLALHGSTTSGRELTPLRDGHETIDLLLSAGPILGSDGEPLGCVISFIDVTDRRRAAAERLQLLERTNEAWLEAESANRAKDEFLAMLGHELRNPLAPILTALELMKLRDEESSRRERDVIERQVTHVVRLVSDLLDVSRIAQGKVELHRRPLGLADVIARAIEVASPILEEREHELDIDIADGLFLHGDEARVCQVLSNLLTNAAKYTERRGQIEIRASRVGKELVVVVRDNGMGIAPELLPNLFDLFVQGTRTIERSEGGLGLGLSIVRSLVQLHGGRVAVRSDGVGKGSEFEVRFPAIEPARAQVAPVVVEPAAGDADGAASRRVLIVDDNTDAAEMLAEALSELGHETRIAHDGPSGLGVVESFVPDIAFLDIGLPAMDGYELARRMRVQVARPELRLVALTGYGQDSDRKRSAEAGFDYHLVKPIDVRAVVSTIKRLT
ncbi:MAG: Chemotaxis protein methyltransferase CheR [Myxococcales bacterium]|nr:Chemotaxis protein methyltransferase CheR [Myxococcales bacterium]